MRRDLGTILKFVSAGQESQRLERILAAAPMTPDLLFVCYEVGLLPEALLTLASHLTEQHLEKAYYRAVKERVDAIAQVCRTLLQGSSNSWSSRFAHASSQDLVQAARKGDLEGMRFLLETMNGDVNTTETNIGQTLVSLAAEAGHTEVTRYLISRGANVSVPDNREKTALFWATREGKVADVLVLLEAGALVAQSDVIIANERGRAELEALLKEWMQRQA